MKKVAEIQNKVLVEMGIKLVVPKALKHVTFLVNEMNGPAWRDNQWHVLEFEEHDFRCFSHHHL